MAAATVVLAGRLCRRLAEALRGPGCAGLSISGVHKSTTQLSPLSQSSFVHTSPARRGIEEFFDDPKNWGETTVKSGDSWSASQLRAKGSEDLHKLWYVLLKEKNVLLTLEQEAKRQKMAMPSPERLEKINLSITRLDIILKERENCLRLLQTGQEKGRPGDWRHDCFGMTTWYKFSEWPIPWYVNRKYKQRKFYALPYVDHFVRLRIEKHLRKQARRKRAKVEEQIAVEKKFPHLVTNSQK